MTEIYTLDLSKFGFNELREAIELLQAYVDDQPSFLNDTGLTLNFNPMSGYVFLSDEDYNIGILENEKVVQFFTCPMCGYEGTQEEATAEGKDFEDHDGYCCRSCEDENEGK